MVNSSQGPLVPSCDTAVALGDATDGGVLLAKNSDRSPHEAQRLIGVPAADHAAGTALHCQYISIPHVAHTAALIGSQPYWLWGFEHGMNEHGVAIGNEAIFTRETPQESGLLGMDLVRLGLERGSTARAALNAITGLLEEFGQGGSAHHHDLSYYDNSFLIADPHEAWVLETCGRHWVARHLTQGVYAISNRPTIGAAYELASGGIVEYAEERGWWPRGRRPFDFAAAVTDPASDALEGATCRLTRSRHHLSASARAALTADAMMALLRDHGADAESGAALEWPDTTVPASVCWHGPDGSGFTAGSMVARLRPGALPEYWASLALPCTGVFIPCWPDAGPPEAMALADETPAPESPWWRYRRLWEAVAVTPDAATALRSVRAAWAPLEQRLRHQVAALDPSASAQKRRALSDAAFAEALEILSHLETGLVRETVASAQA